MALISCPECGREISDRADSCPHCGCPLTQEPKIEYAPFTLRRESKAFFCAVKYEVYLDYELWGVLKNGESLNATLICGTHHLRLIDKNNFNKVVHDNDFTLGEDGLTLTFAAAMNPTFYPSPNYNNSNTQAVRSRTYAQQVPVASAPVRAQAPGGRTCPRCGGIMTVQTVSESRKSGCGTILLYVILALTIFGLLIVIPLMLRKKTETVTYAVCQNCGYKSRL